MKKSISLILALILCVGLLAGCAKEEKPAGGTDGKPVAPEADKPYEFYWVRSGEESILNPHMGGSSNDSMVVSHIMASLYCYIPNEEGTGSELVPDLAASLPETSDGGITWTIKIDPNAKWANGEKIDAHTFEYSYKMQLDPKMLYTTASGAANYFVEIKGAEEYYKQGLDGNIGWDTVGIKAISDDTLQITCAKKETQINVMRQYSRAVTAPVYEPMYEKLMNADRTATEYGTTADKLMCCGMFKLDDWVKGTQINMSKNENYVHADWIHIDKVHSRMVKDEATRMELFEKGESDYLQLGTTGMAKYGEDPRVVTYPKTSIETIEVNQNNPDKPYLDDPLFRKALFYAVDREKIAQVTGAGPAPFFLSVVDQGLDDGTLYRELPEVQANVPANNGYDPELAKKYFDQVLEKYNLDKITVDLMYTEGTEYRRLSSEYLQSSLPKIFGEDKFEMKLSANSFSLLNKTMRESTSKPTNKWDLCWSSWGLSAEPTAPWKKIERYTTWHPRRYTMYKNAKVDELVELCQTDEYRLDDKKLAAITADMEKAMYEDMTCVPCFYVNQHVMYSDRVDLPMKQHDLDVGFGWEFSKLK